jgi:uncharacterized phosphosugar-binding protein
MVYGATLDRDAETKMISVMTAMVVEESIYAMNGAILKIFTSGPLTMVTNRVCRSIGKIMTKDILQKIVAGPIE